MEVESLGAAKGSTQALPVERRKHIRSIKDLAIHGAAPAFHEPLHVGRPNVGDRARFDALLDGAFERAWLTNNGPLVQQLEHKIASYLKVRHCLAINNGTVAIEIAAKALELEGEVIVPSYTFIATASALQWIGLKPVFADIDPITHNLEPASVRRAITARTSAIVGVHLWGRGAPHDQLQGIADKYGLKLMYDAAHAFGCSMGGEMIGKFGACEVLSFHATKFFNTFEGGAIVTNDDALAQRIALMRNFGFAGFDNVVSAGANGKMNEACAAMGLVNLEHLDSVVAANRGNHQAYEEMLGGIEGLKVLSFDAAERNNYQYVVVEIGPEFPVSRDRLLDALRAENILARKYFWPGCHRMAQYANVSTYAGLVLPSTELVASRVIVLPTGPKMIEDDIALICRVFQVLRETDS